MRVIRRTVIALAALGLAAGALAATGSHTSAMHFHGKPAGVAAMHYWG